MSPKAKSGTLEEKRKRAKGMTSHDPAVLTDFEGNTHVVTMEEIEVMDENEVDVVIDTIMRQARDGTHPKYANIQALQAALDGYWKSIMEKRRRGIDIYPDVEGVCAYLGVSRSTMGRWKNQNVNGFGATIEQLYTNIAAVKKQIAMHGNMPPLIFMADFNNNHDYVNTSKMEVHQNNASVIPDTVSLLEQIRNLPDNGGE